MNAPPRRNLRADMPQTTAWIDEWRAAFGVEGINEVIRSGMAGSGDFYAVENGIEVGARSRYQNGVCAAQMVLAVPEAEEPVDSGLRAAPRRRR